MRHSWQITLLALALAPMLALASDAPDPTLLVGAPDAVWLITPQAGKAGSPTFRIARRTIDKTWEFQWPLLQGTPEAAAARKDALGLFFPDGTFFEYLAESQDSRPGIKPPDSLLPPGSEVLAACFDARDEGSLFLLASRKHVEPASQPATASAPSSASASAPSETLIITSRPALSAASAPVFLGDREVVLLHSGKQQWSQVGIVPLPPELLHVTSMLSLQDKLYLLYRHGAVEGLMLLDEAWRQVAFPQEEGRNLTLIPLNGQPVLVRQMPDKSLVMLARQEDGWQAPVAVHLEKQSQPFVWKDAAPLVAWTKDHLALLWQADQERLFAFVSPAGEMAQPQDVATKPGEILMLAYRCSEAFIPTMLALTVILLFWPGQPMRTAPFSLPPGLGPIATFDAPGPAFSYLFRRFLAILIDLFPFSMAALIWHAWSGLPVSDDFKAMLNSPEIIVLGTALNISYLLYCILMEGIAGATMGKMAMHLRVVGDKGRKATWREIALRNVTKVPETIPTILLLTLLFPILTRLHQRLGDRIAWTAVIDSRAKALPIPPPLPGNMV